MLNTFLFMETQNTAGQTLNIYLLTCCSTILNTYLVTQCSTTLKQTQKVFWVSKGSMIINKGKGMMGWPTSQFCLVFVWKT
jgi:hypothetical protein